jgi:hypothetical protein
MLEKRWGRALTPFIGSAQPQHSIAGPGRDAFKMIPGTDRATYLVSPGVFDCAILTLVLAGRPSQGRMGTHRAQGARAMAHYNPFNGPQLDGLKTLFDSILRPYGAAPNDLVVSISYHADVRSTRRGANFEQLATLVGQAVPALSSVSLHSYGVIPSEGQTRKAVTIYLTPAGDLRGSE